MSYPTTDGPGAVDTPITRVDAVDIIYADDFNYSDDQIQVIQKFLGWASGHGGLVGDDGDATHGTGGLASPITSGGVAFTLAAQDDYAAGKLLSVGDNYDVSYSEKFYVDHSGKMWGSYLQLAATVTIDEILDEDDMNSDSATALATQQSIKKYVDDNVGGTSYWSRAGTILSPVNSGDTVRVGYGNASQPAFSCEFDPNTGLFFTSSAADTILFSCGGAQTGYIDPNGIEIQKAYDPIYVTRRKVTGTPTYTAGGFKFISRDSLNTSYLEYGNIVCKVTDDVLATIASCLEFQVASAGSENTKIAEITPQGIGVKTGSGTAPSIYDLSNTDCGIAIDGATTYVIANGSTSFSISTATAVKRMVGAAPDMRVYRYESGDPAEPYEVGRYSFHLRTSVLSSGVEIGRIECITTDDSASYDGYLQFNAAASGSLQGAIRIKPYILTGPELNGAGEPWLYFGDGSDESNPSYAFGGDGYNYGMYCTSSVTVGRNVAFTAGGEKVVNVAKRGIGVRSDLGILIDGQDETSYDNSPTTEGTFNGGSGYINTEVITLEDGTTVTVDNQIGGVVDQFTITSTANSIGGIGRIDLLDQTSSTGSGTGFRLIPDTDNIYVLPNLCPIDDITTGIQFDTISEYRVGVYAYSARLADFSRSGGADTPGELTLYHTSGSDTGDGNYVAHLSFVGWDDADNEQIYARVDGYCVDSGSDSEDGELRFSTALGSLTGALVTRWAATTTTLRAVDKSYGPALVWTATNSSSPSFSFVDNYDLGIYRSIADVMSFAAEGNRVGNVTRTGISTTVGMGVPTNAQDETKYDNSPTTEGTFSGGTGHNAADVITMSDGTTVTVDAESGNVVTEFTVDSSSSDGGYLAGDVLTQVSSTGSGINFSLTLDTDNITAMPSFSAYGYRTGMYSSDGSAAEFAGAGVKAFEANSQGLGVKPSSGDTPALHAIGYSDTGINLGNNSISLCAGGELEVTCYGGYGVYTDPGVVTKKQNVTSSSGEVDINIFNGFVVRHILTENTEIQAPSPGDADDGMILTIILVQPGSGSYTVDFNNEQYGFWMLPTGYVMSESLASEIVVDVLRFIYDITVDQWLEISRSQALHQAII